MSQSSEPVDYNDPRARDTLRKLLDTPEDLSPAVNSHTIKKFRGAVLAAMELPPGEARVCLLESLWSGLNAIVWRRESNAQMEVLRAQLKAQSPQLLAVHSRLDGILSTRRTLDALYEKAFLREKAAGRDPWKTTWAWFGHELNASLYGLEFQVRHIREALVDAPLTEADAQAPSTR